MMHTELTEVEETVFHWLCQVQAHLVALFHYLVHEKMKQLSVLPHNLYSWCPAMLNRTVNVKQCYTFHKFQDESVVGT